MHCLTPVATCNANLLWWGKINSWHLLACLCKLFIAGVFWTCILHTMKNDGNPSQSWNIEHSGLILLMMTPIGYMTHMVWLSGSITVISQFVKGVSPIIISHWLLCIKIRRMAIRFVVEMGLSVRGSQILFWSASGLLFTQSNRSTWNGSRGRVRGYLL